MFVEQCRELDIAIALTPKGVNGVAAMMRKPPSSQLLMHSTLSSQRDGGSLSRPSTPFGGTSQAGGGIGAIEKLGKELNKGLLTLMNDLKTPRGVSTVPTVAQPAPQAAPRCNSASGGELGRTSAPGGGAPRSASVATTFQQPVGADPDLDVQLAKLEAAGPLPPVGVTGLSDHWPLMPVYYILLRTTNMSANYRPPMKYSVNHDAGDMMRVTSQSFHP